MVPRTIADPDVSFREISSEDSVRLREWRNSDSVRLAMINCELVGEADHARWLTALLQDDNRYAWVVALDGLDVGAVFLGPVSRENGRASWGVYVGDVNARGRGVGTAALEYALTFAFETLRINKVTCEVLSTNAIALQWYSAYGFVTEGVLRQHLWRAPNWIDLHLLAIFASDWRERRPQKAGR